MSRRIIILFNLSLIWSMGLWAAPHPLEAGYGQAHGYITDTQSERFTRVSEVTPVLNPDKPIDYSQLIFRPKLEKEFKSRYEDNFGQYSVERSYGVNTHFVGSSSSYGVMYLEQEQIQEQQEFGEFMIKRLTEDHLDQFSKTSPVLRPAYELKERLSNVSLEVKKGYKFKLHYSLSGNYFSIQLSNPYDIYTDLVLEMDPNSFGPGEVLNRIISFGYDLDKSTRIDSKIGLSDTPIYTFSGSQKLSKVLTASVTTSSIVHDPDNFSDRERLVLFGFAWTY
jgi:hypothetical protein